MRSIHHHLSNKYRWYDTWHRFRFHPHIHWGVFGTFSLLSTLKVLAVILSSSLISLSALPALAASQVWTSQADWEGWTKTQTSSSITDGSLTLDGTPGELAVTATTAISRPRWVDISTDNSFAFVSNDSDNTVSRIRTSDNTVTATINVGNTAADVAISPDDSFVYVANNLDNTVSRIRTSDNTVTATINVGSYPLVIDISPDGTFAYVTNSVGDSVSRIQTSDNTVTATINVGDFPRGISISPDNSFAYVVNGNPGDSGNGTVSRIRTSDNTVTATINVGDGTYPFPIDISPDGTFAYVGHTPGGNGKVSRIRTSDDTITATISGSPPMGDTPWDLVISPDNNYLYFNDGSSIVYKLQTSDNTIVDYLAYGPPSLWGIAVSQDGSFIYSVKPSTSPSIARIENGSYTYQSSGTASVSFDGTNTYNKWTMLTKAETTNSQTIAYYGASDTDATCPATPTPGDPWSGSWTALSFSGNDADLSAFTHSRYLCLGANLSTADTAITPQVDSLSLTYSQDTVPTLTVSVPANNDPPNCTVGKYYTKTGTLTASGTATDDGTVSLVEHNFNSAGYASSSGTTSWNTGSLSLVAGDNTIAVRAKDDINQYSTVASKTVNYDSGNPIATITSPTANTTYLTKNSTVSLSGTASDAGGGVSTVKYAVGGGDSVDATGTTGWSASSIPLSVGDNLITVTATDCGGNTASDTITVTYDNTLPAVSISAPTTPTNNPSLTLTGTASDNIEIASISSNVGTPSGTTSWTVSGITLSEGSNTITVTATDTAGNTATDTITVTYDNTDPTVSISSSTTSTTALYTISGTSADTGGTGVASVSISGAADGNGTATGTESWSKEVTLAEGINSLTVTSTDNATNTSADAISVIYTPPSDPDDPDTTAPNVSIDPNADCLDDGAMDLSWTKSTSSDTNGYLIVRYLDTDTQTTPTTGTTYTAGNTLGVGKIIAVTNSATATANDSDISYDTYYVYIIYAFDGSKNYSTGAEVTKLNCIQNHAPGIEPVSP